MSAPTESRSLSPEHFKTAFAAIAPLILSEWSAVSAPQLQATEGDLEQVITCIATATDHTRTLIRHQLQELYQIAVAQHHKKSTSRFTERLTQLANERLTDTQLKDTFAHIEERTEDLLQQFKQEMLPEFQEQVQQHPIKSVLTAVGIGFVLGLLIGGRRGR